MHNAPRSSVRSVAQCSIIDAKECLSPFGKAARLGKAKGKGLVEVDGGSTSRLEGHGVQPFIGLILGMQQSPYLGGGIAFHTGRTYDRTSRITPTPMFTVG